MVFFFVKGILLVRNKPDQNNTDKKIKRPR